MLSAWKDEWEGQVEYSLIGQDLALSPSSCLYLYMRTFRAEVKSNCKSSVSYFVSRWRDGVISSPLGHWTASPIRTRIA